MDGFPFVLRERVRFRDLDSMGHVNNAVYSTYLEESRLAYLAAASPQGLPQEMILAHVEIDFRSQLSRGEEVEIGTRASRVGTKSIELEHEIRADGRLVAEGKSVLVGFDYATGETKPIPDEWRSLLAPAPA